ncbi:MAG TPA: 50S ribosomal protein L35ae [Candidatus Bathyarchaeota archaeon]|nr:50S ribosomal protein L35ae [Candidatus Bathyarchaeota archaeon]
MEEIHGVIVSYRRGPKTQKPKECLLMFQNVKSPSEASNLIGRKVAWPVKERKCIGKIVDVHGNKGLVRARFRKGIPGNAIGTEVELI